MKNKIILVILILSMITLIFSGCVGGSVTPPMPDDTDDSEIPESEVCNLPTYPINIEMQHIYYESYFDIELKNVGSGYDIYDGNWTGWCADKETLIESYVWYQGYVYCSYNPSNRYGIDWPKINWIINNKGSYSVDYIQEAIWHFTNGHTPNGLAMAAEAHSDFCPQSGQKYIAIIDVPGKQLTFIEIPFEAATITDNIYRGQEKGWFLDPGDTLVVYYYPDGSSSTVAWKNNWFYWVNNEPFTTINIYCAPSSGGPWSWMYVSSVAPYYKSLPLLLNEGAYKFEIKNYTKGDTVYLKVY